MVWHVVRGMHAMYGNDYGKEAHTSTHQHQMVTASLQKLQSRSNNIDINIFSIQPIYYND